MGKSSPAAGKKYHILDGGPPVLSAIGKIGIVCSHTPPFPFQVDSFAFWYPMIAGIGCSLPSFRIPYSLAYALGILFEQLHRVLGWEPLFTRYEVVRIFDLF